MSQDVSSERFLCKNDFGKDDSESRNSKPILWIFPVKKFSHRTISITC